MCDFLMAKGLLVLVAGIAIGHPWLPAVGGVMQLAALAIKATER